MFHDPILMCPVPKLQMALRQLISRNLSWRKRVPSVSLHVRSAKQAFVLACVINFNIASRYAGGEQRRARGCNSPQGAINAMQRGWPANSMTGRASGG